MAYDQETIDEMVALLTDMVEEAEHHGGHLDISTVQHGRDLLKKLGVKTIPWIRLPGETPFTRFWKWFNV